MVIDGSHRRQWWTTSKLMSSQLISASGGDDKMGFSIRSPSGRSLIPRWVLAQDEPSLDGFCFVFYTIFCSALGRSCNEAIMNQALNDFAFALKELGVRSVTACVMIYCGVHLGDLVQYSFPLH